MIPETLKAQRLMKKAYFSPNVRIIALDERDNLLLTSFNIHEEDDENVIDGSEDNDAWSSKKGFDPEAESWY